MITDESDEQAKAMEQEDRSEFELELESMSTYAANGFVNEGADGL